MVAGKGFFQSIQRTGANIAIHDTNRSQKHGGQFFLLLRITHYLLCFEPSNNGAALYPCIRLNAISGTAPRSPDGNSLFLIGCTRNAYQFIALPSYEMN